MLQFSKKINENMFRITTQATKNKSNQRELTDDDRISRDCISRVSLAGGKLLFPEPSSDAPRTKKLPRKTTVFLVRQGGGINIYNAHVTITDSNIYILCLDVYVLCRWISERLPNIQTDMENIITCYFITKCCNLTEPLTLALY